MDGLYYLHKMRNGEEEGFNFFFKTWYAALYLFALKIVYDKEVAEEKAEDAMLKLWQQRQQFDSLDAIPAFLYRVTKNACLNYLRDQKRLGAGAASYIAIQDTTQQPLQEAIIEAETIRQIYQHFSALPPQCKMIMQQLYIAGKDAREIAVEQHLTINTVRVQKMIGVRKLKALLKATS
ncbi:MAG: sigma-70 family RNA polymerase sigma factor [Chitinophagaceae bacterium]|nr:MAG: sigma-70 family RNA polymerase sigma factor [Chitinophagaceae bacterium]